MRMLAIHIHRGDLKKLYNGKNKIPMQIFHDAYFDFKGDVLEILEQHHDWAKFTFTQELFRYVFMDFIPELIVHSKNQDEEQSAITTSSTHVFCCGWGTLVAYAAKNFGVTLGKNQAKFGTERIAQNGIPADKVRILCCDYREDTSPHRVDRQRDV
ncbi:hypothetical protein B0H14DRAFT_3515308 [Mycena olivaceomarginata]|nr:hypothetical protein B0H14DRAFT_3515308 [Mycena olivaceomarginata]